MAANRLAREAMKVRQFHYLTGISCRKECSVAPFFQLFDDGNKERNMRRIIEINPNPFWSLRAWQALTPFGTRSSALGWRFGEPWFVQNGE
jgi:hypothetical protein